MTIRALMLATCVAALSACSQLHLFEDTASGVATATQETTKPQYTALPGRAATYGTPSDTATAFEHAAAAYGVKPTQASSSAPATSAPAATTTSAPVALPSADRPVWRTVSSAPGAPYAVQITNGTNGRLFIEAIDEGENIFPFGFMHAGQRLGALPQDPRPIQGHITVIVRDPDRAGAPELRRYQIAPPQNYEGKTIGITLLPGGRYRASLDGVVYYTTPEEPAATPAPGLTH